MSKLDCTTACPPGCTGIHVDAQAVTTPITDGTAQAPASTGLPEGCERDAVYSINGRGTRSLWFGVIPKRKNGWVHTPVEIHPVGTRAALRSSPPLEAPGEVEGLIDALIEASKGFMAATFSMPEWVERQRERVKATREALARAYRASRQKQIHGSKFGFLPGSDTSTDFPAVPSSSGDAGGPPNTPASRQGVENPEAWKMVEKVIDTFTGDMMVGYRTSDKVYAVEMLTQALRLRASRQGVGRPTKQEVADAIKESVPEALREVAPASHWVREALAKAWRDVSEHPGIRIDVKNDEAASVWNALCRILDPLHASLGPDSSNTPANKKDGA